MAFYEYLLERCGVNLSGEEADAGSPHCPSQKTTKESPQKDTCQEEADDEDDEQEDDDDDDEDEEQEEEEEEEEEDDDHDHEEDKRGKSRPGKQIEDESSSINTQDFNAQHNDLCDVCDGDGELLMCSTCNLVFHLECTRPVLTHLPTEKYWRCSYCILASEPKNSKPRRAAAAAVRMMARIRNQFKRNNTPRKSSNPASLDEEEEEEDQNSRTNEDNSMGKVKQLPKGGSKQSYTYQHTSSVGKNTTDEEHTRDDDNNGDEMNSAVPSETRTDEASQRTTTSRDDNPQPPLDKQRRESTGNPVDELSKSNDSGPENQIRSKRPRKQPTLYDPQLGPARKWQSDELVEWKASVKSDDDEAASQSRNTDEQECPRKRSDTTWCGFCGDDPAIKVCFFCACRVCFGKHHQSRLLLCDRCDDEYHIFCLNPPLRKVPKRKWYCPNCSKAEDIPVGRVRGDTRSQPVISPTRGRPRKSEEAKNRIKATEPKSTQPKSTLTPKTPPKKVSPQNRATHLEQPRTSTGRFAPFPKHARAASKSHKRKSRPVSTMAAIVSSKKRPRDETPKKKNPVGRPPKSRPMDGSEDEPPEKFYAAAGSTDENKPKPIAVTVSRSGRKVKRNQFHDEIIDNASQLKSPRQEVKSSKTNDDVEVIPGSSRYDEQGSLPNEVLLTAPMEDSQAETTEQVSSIEVASEIPVVEWEASPQSESVAVPVPSCNEPVTQIDDPAAPDDDPVQTPKIMQSEEDEIELLPPLENQAVNPMEAQTSTGSVATAPAGDTSKDTKQPRRKPGARECMQISRRFGAEVIPQKYMDTLLDYCKRGKVEHLIRMRERLDDHARFLESQLAGLEALVQQKATTTTVSTADRSSAEKINKSEPRELDFTV